MDKYQLIIDGEKAATNEHFEVRNPSTGAVVGLAPIATAADLDRAISAAGTAFAKWSKMPDPERRALCHAAGKKIGEHAEELARLLTQEQGKPLNGMGSRFELGGVRAWTHHTADIPMPVKVLQDNNEGRIELHRKPIGVVGSITPWNWPLIRVSVLRRVSRGLAAFLRWCAKARGLQSLGLARTRGLFSRLALLRTNFEYPASIWTLLAGKRPP
jgi:acyl-CoA reductase-like NAD-dependent aldehyde dehydrogenase